MQLKPYPIGVLLELTAEKRRRKECFRKGDSPQRNCSLSLEEDEDIFWDRASTE